MKELLYNRKTIIVFVISGEYIETIYSLSNLNIWLYEG